jgi:hypothetical protein
MPASRKPTHGEPYKDDPLPLPKKINRPVKYNPDEFMPRVIDLMARGHLILEISHMDDFPSYAVIHAAFQKEPWATLYAQARVRQAHAIAERAILEAERATGDPQLARLKFDARRWFVGKIAPKHYGDRVEHHVEAGESYVEALRLASERIRKRTLEGNRVFDVPDDADAQPKFIGSESVSDATNNRAKSKT